MAGDDRESAKGGVKRKKRVRDARETRERLNFKHAFRASRSPVLAAHTGHVMIRRLFSRVSITPISHRSPLMLGTLVSTFLSPQHLSHAVTHLS